MKLLWDVPSPIELFTKEINMENATHYRNLYILAMLLMVLSGLYVYAYPVARWMVSEQVRINLQQVLVMLAMLGIPGMLVWSKKEVARIRLLPDLPVRQRRYQKVLYLRLAVLIVLAVFSLIVHLLTAMPGGMMLYAALLLMFLFIWPTKSRMSHEMGEKSDEELS